MDETIKNIPTGWAMATVSQVGEVRLGRQRSPKNVTGRHNTKYLRSANVKPGGRLDLSDILEMDFTPEERLLYTLKAGDVLLVVSSGSATQLGRAVIWEGQIQDCCYQNHLVRFRARHVSPEYALIAFKHMSEAGMFASAARGIGIQHLGVGRFAQMPFPLPPLAEQHRIVAEVRRRIEELDAAESALRSAIDRTLQQDRLILQSAVEGSLVEPESTVALREKRAFEPAKDLINRIRASDEDSILFSISQESISDGPIAGWARLTVGQVGAVRLGRQRSPEFERGAHPTPYLRAANITLTGLDLSDVLRMNFAPAERAVFELRPGDVVLSEASGSSAHVGRAAIWTGEIPGCCYQNTVIRFRPIAVTSAFALLVFRHFAESGLFAKVARGVGIQHLGGSRFAEIEFPLPPAEEQVRIVKEAEARLAVSNMQRRAAQASLAQFQNMRREIWLAAVSGKLVEQDATEKPATELLALLTENSPPHQSNDLKGRKENIMASPSRRKARNTNGIRPLVSVLAESGRPLPLPELFASAGYDRDSAADVESFYLTLRGQVDKEINIVEAEKENALVELRNAS